jgi:hypothetical protein
MIPSGYHRLQMKEKKKKKKRRAGNLEKWNAPKETYFNGFFGNTLVLAAEKFHSVRLPPNGIRKFQGYESVSSGAPYVSDPAQ